MEREGAEGRLSKLIRSAGRREGLSVPFVSSKSKSASFGPALGASKSYVSDGDARRSFETSASTLVGAVGGIRVTGRGEGTAVTRDSSASRALRAPWITGGELVAASLAVLLSTVWSAGLLLVSKAVRLHPLGSAVSGFGGAVVARAEAVCAGVSVSKATVCGCMGSLATGGFGARFLVSRAGEDDVEDTVSGDTGGLALLAFRAASLGECLRFGGIGVPAF